MHIQILLLVTIFTAITAIREGDQYQRAETFMRNLFREANRGRRHDSKLRQLFRDDFVFEDCQNSLNVESTINHILADRGFSFTIGSVTNQSNANIIHFETNINSDICQEIEKLKFKIYRMFDEESETHYYSAAKGSVRNC